MTTYTEADVRQIMAGMQADIDKERTARQSAQIENEALKDRIARAGVEMRRAVWKERKECAAIVRANAEACTSGLVRDVLLSNAAAIDARNADAPDLRPNRVAGSESPSVAVPEQQTTTLLQGDAP